MVPALRGPHPFPDPQTFHLPKALRKSQIFENWRPRPWQGITTGRQGQLPHQAQG